MEDWLTFTVMKKKVTIPSKENDTPRHQSLLLACLGRVKHDETRQVQADEPSLVIGGLQSIIAPQTEQKRSLETT